MVILSKRKFSEMYGKEMAFQSAGILCCWLCPALDLIYHGQLCIDLRGFTWALAVFPEDLGWDLTSWQSRLFSLLLHGLHVAYNNDWMMLRIQELRTTAETSASLLSCWLCTLSSVIENKQCKVNILAAKILSLADCVNSSEKGRITSLYSL